MVRAPILLISAIVLSISNCGNSELQTKTVLWGKADATVELTRIAPSSEKPADLLVYGSLTLAGFPPNASTVNLDCIELSINGTSSEKIYVDSVAHVLPDTFSIENGALKVDVYWLFRNLPLKMSSVTKVAIQERDDYKSCVVATSEASR